jgi:hypothetical protein
MRGHPRDTGGPPPRHNIGQRLVRTADTVGKIVGVAQSIYSAGKVIAPYVRPVLTALAAAAV